MRDPNRIDGFCNELAKVWKRHPDCRFGQTIVNVLGRIGESCDDLYYIEDEKIQQCFDSLAKPLNQKGASGMEDTRYAVRLYKEDSVGPVIHIYQTQEKAEEFLDSVLDKTEDNKWVPRRFTCREGVTSATGTNPCFGCKMNCDQERPECRDKHDMLLACDGAIWYAVEKVHRV